MSKRIEETATRAANRARDIARAHPRHGPVYFAERAREAAEDGDHALAAELYGWASAKTLGHNRAARYDAAAAEQRRLAEEAS